VRRMQIFSVCMCVVGSLWTRMRADALSTAVHKWWTGCVMSSTRQSLLQGRTSSCLPLTLHLIS
jgi:hypothetical protein